MPDARPRFAKLWPMETMHRRQAAKRARMAAGPRAAELRDRLRRVQEDLGRQREPLPRDAPDAAIVIENDEILAAIDKAARSELDHIEHALERLDAGRIRAV